MITVTIIKEGGNYKSMRAVGHAGYSKPGEEDIVCSAVSALIQTAIQGIINTLGYSEYHMKPGDQGLVVKDGMDSLKVERANIILETIHDGLSAVSSLYKDNVKIEMEG